MNPFRYFLKLCTEGLAFTLFSRFFQAFKIYGTKLFSYLTVLVNGVLTFLFRRETLNSLRTADYVIRHVPKTKYIFFSLHFREVNQISIEILKFLL